MYESIKLVKACCCLLVLAGCGGFGPHPPARVADRIAAYDGPVTEPDTENRLIGVEAKPAQLGAVPADFLVTVREPHLTRAPCGSCHGAHFSAPAGQAAHWEIFLEHGSPETMNCATCHREQDKSLHSLTGAAIHFDQGYNLCGQCHFQQQRDWAGGSHGKRVATWAGPRVIRNCTACHDPHKPAFPTRWPAMAPGPINTRPVDHSRTKHE